eukprot:6490568-Amphidinium_carterae.1
MTRPVANFKGSPNEITFSKLRLPSSETSVVLLSLGDQPRSGLLTGYGLDFLAKKLSGPKVDRATLQLVGVLFASIVLPGLAGKQVKLPAHLP